MYHFTFTYGVLKIDPKKLEAIPFLISPPLSRKVTIYKLLKSFTKTNVDIIVDK